MPIHALLFQLTTQQLRLLLGLSAAFLRIAQFAVGIFQSQARKLEFVFHRHAFIELLFELHPQLFQRRFALLQIEVELLAFLVQALGLQLQAF